MARIDIGGNGYEIYGAEADYELYLNAQPRTAAWEALAASVKQESIIAAGRLLDRQRWRGSPTLPVVISFAAAQPVGTQGLQWPRSDINDRNGVAVPDTDIPSDVQLAAYELAFLLSTGTPTVETADAEQRLEKEVRVVGPLRIENTYFESIAGEGGRFPQLVQELVGFYLESGESLVIGDFGTDQCSNFAPDKYGLSGLGFK